MLQNTLYQLSKPSTAKLFFKEEEYATTDIIARAIEIISELKKNSPNFIALWLPNSPELLCWQLAAFYLGIPIVPIIYEQSATLVEEIIELIQPNILVVSSEKYTLLKPANNYSVITNDAEFISKATQPLLNFSPSTVSENNLAMIIFSSGTSGELKGIMHSYKTAYGFIETLINVLDVTHGLVYLVAQPMGHIGGIATLLLTLLNQGTICLLQTFHIDNYMQMIKKFKPTHINLHTPLFYEVINYKNIDKNDFKNITSCFAGGDTIPAELPQKFTTATGALMRTGYGMTETGIPILNRNPYNQHAGASGQCIPICEVELKNDKKVKVKEGEIGELWIKSPGNCLGYWQREDLNTKIFSESWFSTGDLAALDTDNYFWFKGRSSQAFSIGNNVVYPDYIENILFNCPGVAVVAVIPCTHQGLENTLVAFFELDPEFTPIVTENSLLNYAKHHLKTWQIPAVIKIIKKIPLNLTGKIDRKRLQSFL